MVCNFDHKWYAANSKWNFCPRCGKRLDSLCPSDETACSDLIEVRMRGGTIIRIPAGRGDGMPYDLLLEALKVCQHWNDDEDEWRDGDPFVYLKVIHGQNASGEGPPDSGTKNHG